MAALDWLYAAADAQPWWVTLTIPGAGLGLLFAIVKWTISANRDINTDMKARLTDTQADRDYYRDDNAALRTHIRELHGEIDRKDEWVDLLQRQVRGMGGTPEPEPRDTP